MDPDLSVVAPPEPAAPPAARPIPAAPPAANPPRSDGGSRSALGWTRSDQRFLAASVLTILALLAGHWYRLSRWSAAPVQVEHSADYVYRIDINAANWVEWSQLEGIGETLARRIVADRDARGPFQRVEDLDRVKGIGPKTLEKLRPQLLVRPPQPAP